jgi:broad specificity phosphatase PhoE
VGGIHHRDEETGEPVGLPGRNRAELAAHYPDLILPASLGSEGWWNRPYEQENQAALRAQRLLSELLAHHGSSDHRVAVISHGGFYNHFVGAILNLLADQRRWFSLNNAAITRFDFDGESTWISYMNRADHLPRELIS